MIEILKHIFVVPFIAGIVAIIFKKIILIIKKEKREFKKIFWAVGMPSGHTATFAALTTYIGLLEGITSPIFAIVLIFSTIYIYDLILVYKVIHKNKIRKFLLGKLGHTFSEVFWGAVIGIITAYLIYLL
jgi:acid phosphatase family membrane protein YuiD